MEFAIELEEELGNCAEDENLIVYKKWIFLFLASNTHTQKFKSLLFCESTYELLSPSRIMAKCLLCKMFGQIAPIISPVFQFLKV